MNTRPFATTLAIVLMVVVVAPAVLFVAPQRVNAYPAEILSDVSAPSLTTAAKTTVNAIESTLIQASAATSAWAADADWVYKYVLQPLAFIESGKLMKMMTASVISFVIGKANGTGVPQFAVDVQKSMQGVSDGAALAYLKQVGNTNSPFAGSIASALSTDYLTGSSLKGFWAANMCTLAQSSQNVPAYLAGNWSQGGVAAWFALTTETQNNPYTFYQNTQTKLATVIGPGAGGVTGTRASELNWGQGFMSWCGATEDTTSSFLNTQLSATSSYAYTLPASAPGGINPGDPCMKDGNPGTIQTPGSLIKSTLDKVLGGQQDQIVRMGDVSGQVNSILADIGTVFKTVNFATQLLGGNTSGGLLSAGASSPSGASVALSQLRSMSTLGLTSSGVVSATAASRPDSSVTGAGMLDRISQYQAAWGTVGAAAGTASTSVVSLAAACTAAANSAALDLWTRTSGTQTVPTQAQLDSMHSTFIDTARAQAAAVPVALSTEIAPIIAQAATNTSPATFASTITLAQQVQSDLASGSTAYATDLQTLQTMPPTQTDLAKAQLNAESLQSATAVPPGSLTVPSAPSVPTTDRMNLISTNAQALKTSVCTYNSSGTY